VRKIGYIDLLKIADPDKLARKPLIDGVLKFPFFTIENVDVVDRHAHRGRQRQQPALLEQPRAEQGRRQRTGAAGSRARCCRRNKPPQAGGRGAAGPAMPRRAGRAEGGAGWGNRARCV
jgi:hypothetical protein